MKNCRHRRAWCRRSSEDFCARELNGEKGTEFLSLWRRGGRGDTADFRRCARMPGDAAFRCFFITTNGNSFAAVAVAVQTEKAEGCLSGHSTHAKKPAVPPRPPRLSTNNPLSVQPVNRPESRYGTVPASPGPGPSGDVTGGICAIGSVFVRAARSSRSRRSSSIRLCSRCSSESRRGCTSATN